MRRQWVASLAIAAGLLAGCLPEQKSQTTQNNTSEQQALVALGNTLFHDQNLSSEGNQACASCHQPDQHFVDPDHSKPTSKGSVLGQVGGRNTPMAAYTAFVPPLHQELDEGEWLWVGGLFLDGRVDTLEQQASKPLFNPKEMNLADVAMFATKLRASPSATAFKQVFGADALAEGQDDLILERFTQAIAAFERTPTFNSFTSKFDYYQQGRVSLTTLELEGLSVFMRADKGNCAACHVLTPPTGTTHPLFTDFTYDNIGLPINPELATNPVDEGLATTAKVGGDLAQRGKFRVPTLRNVAVTAPYGHNGVFKDLRTVVEFYNTRDTDPQRWGQPEVPETVNRSELGNLQLSDREIDALVAFMNTLTDGYQP